MKITKEGICFKYKQKIHERVIPDQITWVWPWRRVEKGRNWLSQKFRRYFKTKHQYKLHFQDYVNIAKKIYEQQQKLNKLDPDTHLGSTHGVIE